MARNRISDFSPEIQAQIRAAIGGKKRSKFNVSDPKERTVGGVVFDSKLEMRIAKWLQDHIACPIVRQPRFLLLPGDSKQRPIFYAADFVIGSARVEFTESGELEKTAVVIDAKGFRTAVFKLKRKMFRARYGRDLFLPEKIADLYNFPWAEFNIPTKFESHDRH